MHRFFLPPESIQSNQVSFTQTLARQISKVLRLREGDTCLVLDNCGKEYLTRLVRIIPGECTGEIVESRAADEPETRLLMMLSLTQREKFEWMLQKCTEVGAAEFLPVISQRSLVQDKDATLAKYERWQMILKEAAEQSGRGMIPHLHPPATLQEAVTFARRQYPICLIPWEGERERGIKTVLKENHTERVAVLVGPEGGFSADEVRYAEEEGFIPVSLGKRILRMETAAVVSAAMVFYELE